MALKNVRLMDRASVKDELLEQLTAWSPTERMGAFRNWLRVSLSLVHLHVVTVLEADGPMAMGRLADALDVSVASATGIVDRMEQRGLVERRREPDDRRVVLVHLTDAGHAVFADVAADRRRHLGWALDRMSDRELKAFLIGSRAMRRVRAEALELGTDPTRTAATERSRRTPGVRRPKLSSRPA